MTSVKSLTSLVIFFVYVNTAVSDLQRLIGSVFVGNSTEEQPHPQTLPCPTFGDVDNASVVIQEKGSDQIANILCDTGFGLEGPGQIHCKRGLWKYEKYPACIQRCEAPPFLKNGALEIDGKKDSDGYFPKGSLATYSCIDGYTLFPNEAKYRVCGEKGAWTGTSNTCLPPVMHNCQQPNDILEGYYVLEKPRDYDMFIIGQRVHYSCKPGFSLVGSPVQQCLEDGTWSPKIQPSCSYQMNENANCQLFTIPNSVSSVIQGFQSEDSVTPGTIIEVRCAVNYRNSEAPCQPAKLTCLGGRWLGTRPNCAPAVGCYSPPLVEHATQISMEAPFETGILPTLYPTKSRVTYQCSPGYILEGNQVLTCTSSSCWFPSIPPKCIPGNTYYNPMEANTSLNAMLISASTGAGVLGFLIVICLIIVCRKRKPLARAVPIPAPVVQRADLGDHAALLHPPDRLALIPFADSFQTSQSSLPSYEEATREQRGPGLTVNRLQRPHWPNLVGRRARNSPIPDTVHVARHGSFASHTPSTRSAGDSMGSTDTVAVSEGSTNITLDTASSHSGSQPASCRVHCGSLASFDTGSVVNTEGVPLLEESELEEIHGGDNVSLVLETPSISDTASFKYSTNSADIA